jgi:hypothetical protein
MSGAVIPVAPAEVLADADPPASRALRRAIALVEPVPPALKARQLYQEAKRASLDHIEQLVSAVESARALAEELVAGGDLYGPGLHDLARRMSEDLLWKGRTLQVLGQRQREAAEASRWLA